jgi:predicted deacylase
MIDIKQISFTSLNRGAHLVVLGAVHGNEKCGAAACEIAAEYFSSGKWQLIKGKVSLIPICNPLAYLQNKRFVERNLNRNFYPKPLHTDYEDAIDPILCDILAGADALLDIHSYQSQGADFCFLGTSSAEEIAFSRALAAPLYVYGWAAAFSDNNASKEQRLASLGTTDYVRANKHSGIAVTLECGNHDNPNNVDIAIRAIHNALLHFGLIAGELQNAPQIDAQLAIQMKAVYYKNKAGSMVRNFQHGELLAAHQLIAVYDDGEKITAPYDCYIILPKNNLDAQIGAEWFYLGVQTDFPDAE